MRLYPNSMDFLSPQTSGTGQVAILTRTKDRPILLARALASVLAQEYQKWHLYLVNDGGDRANVDELLHSYEAAFDGRLSVIHHDESKGMEAASNAALKASLGDFIVVHDDDDAWHPSFLARTVEYLLDEKNAAIAAVACKCIVVNERIEGDTVVEEKRQNWSFWKDTVSLSSMLNTNHFPPICLLVRRSVVSAIGPFNSDLPVLGDWDYNLRILMVGDIGTINEPLAYYHHRSVSAESNVYGNSIGAGQTKHTIYGTYYANSLLRPLLQKEPGYLGLLHVLMRRSSEMDDRGQAVRYALHEHLGGMEDRIHKHIDWVESQSIARDNDLKNALKDMRTQISEGRSKRRRSRRPDGVRRSFGNLLSALARKIKKQN